MLYSHYHEMQKEELVARRSRRLVILGVVILTVLAGIAVMTLWRHSLAEKAMRSVSAIYRSRDLKTDPAIDFPISRRALESWNHAKVDYGNVETWHVRHILIEISGLPVAVAIETQRKGRAYEEEWQFNGDRAFYFGLIPKR